MIILKEESGISLTICSAIHFDIQDKLLSLADLRITDLQKETNFTFNFIANFYFLQVFCQNYFISVKKTWHKSEGKGNSFSALSLPVLTLLSGYNTGYQHHQKPMDRKLLKCHWKQKAGNHQTSTKEAPLPALEPAFCVFTPVCCLDGFQSVCLFLLVVVIPIGGFFLLLRFPGKFVWKHPDRKCTNYYCTVQRVFTL